MEPEQFEQLLNYDWMESRIPARNALFAFVTKGGGCPPAVEEMMNRSGQSRWFPEDDGYRVMILFGGGEFDPAIFKLEKGGWNFEECDSCDAAVKAMELCHVTKKDPYILLCEGCYSDYACKK
jgi:hypothetical protein